MKKTILSIIPLITCMIATNIMAAPPKTITNSLNMKFVYIEPGTFIMGSPKNEVGRDSDEKRHRVVINRGFYISITEVTQGQWQKLMGDNPSAYQDLGSSGPVDQVSWNDCMIFIDKLNRIENTDQYRLPTEAEWEYACRSGGKDQ